MGMILVLPKIKNNKKTKKENMDKGEIYKLIQEYLKPSPLVIWGSGATIPLGIPSMEYLKEQLSIQQDGNLEKILSEISDKNETLKYEKKIFNIINEHDESFRGKLDTNSVLYIKDLINYFYNSHPQYLDIITTNYDCVLEYIFSYFCFPYSDGFSGRQFSCFDSSRFRKEKHINLYKVHGSLRWSNKRYCYYNQEMDGIFPSMEKYRKASQEPFRTLIQKSDESIDNAKCFLSIGFGFNDEHLTPKIEQAISEGKSIVIVSKEITVSAKEKLRRASNYVSIESVDENTTRFSYNKNGVEGELQLDGNYWKIQEFKEILTSGENHG